MGSSLDSVHIIIRYGIIVSLFSEEKLFLRGYQRPLRALSWASGHLVPPTSHP